MEEKRNLKKTKKKKSLSNSLSSVLIIILFVAGFGVLLYPFVSNLLAQYNSIKTINTYNKYVSTLSPEAIDEEWTKARQYNDSLAGDPVRDPFIPGSGMALPENYMEVLNVTGDGVMGYLEIPSIDMELPIGHGTEDSVLERKAGHIEQTALPIGGKGTNSVITGHTGLPSAKLFTELTKVKEGEYFFIYVLDKKMTYMVDDIKVIEPEKLESLQAVPGEDYVTLLTCTPYGVNSHRLLVRGVRTPNIDFEEESSKIWTLLVKLWPLWVLLILLIIILWRRKKKKKEK